MVQINDLVLKISIWLMCILFVCFTMDGYHASSLSSILRITFIFISSTILFFSLMNIFRREIPSIICRMDSYPHQQILPYLHSALFYCPSPFLFTKELEMILPVLFSPTIAFNVDHELLDVNAGKPIIRDQENNHKFCSGQISITWPSFSNAYSIHTPIIILVPGLVGDISATYIKRMAIKINNYGWQFCVFNPRSSNGIQVKTPQFYSGGYTEDLRQCINYIHTEKYPGRPLFAIGYSLGANYLAKYIGEEGIKCPLVGAVCCSPPTDNILGGYFIRLRASLNRMLAGLVQKKMLNSADNIAHSFAKYERAKQTSDLREFDHYLIAEQFGYRSASEYYRKSSCGYYLQDIRIPVLFMYAKNDCLIPYHVMHCDDYDGNPYLSCLLTKYGSHSMSFMTGFLFWNSRSWQANVAIEYLHSVLLLHSKSKLGSVNMVP